MGIISKNWCFTSFELTFDLNKLDKYLSYYIWQLEECPDSKRKHMQGYLELKTAMEFHDVKKFIFTSGQHFAKRKGSQLQAIEYCMKLESQITPPIIWGTPSKQGNRNDINELWEFMKTHSMLEIMDEFPALWIRYERAIQKRFDLIAPLRDRETPPEVYIIWGLAGVGKSRFVWDKYHHSIYVKDDSLWWDGYHQQECILIDDFDWSWKREYLLKVLDRYPFRVQIKGAYTALNSKAIYITCNGDPTQENIWDAALARRVKEIIHM